jgi:hypothetical protein
MRFSGDQWATLSVMHELRVRGGFFGPSPFWIGIGGAESLLLAEPP